VLELGDSGPAVVALQTRLSRLGYWLGRADGTFGLTTQQAVYALQKAAGLTQTASTDRRQPPR
jgi:peptidoglycan hydrolase-like protein with peptidoglycan-binding domain